MFGRALQLTRPGLFITGTDTGVGKTAITCAIAASLRKQGTHRARVGVCKPIASGCRHEREGLVNQDAEALAHFADCRQPLDVINPVRYAPPLAPAAAAEQTGIDVDFQAIARSLELIDRASDVMLVEGVGGILTPLDAKGKYTVLDLAAALPYPVLVVARSGLGTLNHTAMTVRLLREAGCTVAGVVMNHYPPPGSSAEAAADPSIQINRRWIEKMTRAWVLATAPQCPPETVQPQRGLLPEELLDAVALCWWRDVMR